jgi:hypothetical protein
MNKVTLASVLFLISTASAVVAGEPPSACAVLSESDAVALVGGPLGEVFKDEIAPTRANGQDHSTSCGYFPRGYNINTADGPPERGLLLTLHAMRNKEDARRFFDNTTDAGADKKGALKGVGDAAALKESKIEGDKVVNFSFLKNSISANLTTWKKGGDVPAIATGAAKKIVAKLP